MALVTFNFESQYLRRNEDVTIILPDKPRVKTIDEFYETGKKYPVLWLLHGTYGDHSDWLRHTGIELYACEKEVMVVMPSGINTNYQNWPYFGNGYYEEDFVVDELMKVVQAFFPASPKREDNFISGLSMGSRGALYLGLKYPDKFSKIAALSGCGFDETKKHDYHVELMKRDPKEYAEELRHEKIGDKIRDFRIYSNIRNAGGVDEYEKNSVPMQVWNMTKGYKGREKEMPEVYCAIGDEDFLYEEFCGYQKLAKELNLPIKFEVEKGMAHEWRFWDKYIEKALVFFGFPEETSGKEFGGKHGRK